MSPAAKSSDDDDYSLSSPPDSQSELDEKSAGELTTSDTDESSGSDDSSDDDGLPPVKRRKLTSSSKLTDPSDFDEWRDDEDLRRKAFLLMNGKDLDALAKRNGIVFPRCTGTWIPRESLTRLIRLKAVEVPPELRDRREVQSIRYKDEEIQNLNRPALYAELERLRIPIPHAIRKPGDSNTATLR